MSVQLQALADEVFEAAAAHDLLVPADMRTTAASGETMVAMVQAFTQNNPSGGGQAMQRPSPSGGGQGGGLLILPVQDEEQWLAFEGLIRADTEERGWTEAMSAELVALYRWRAANTPHRFFLAYHGDRGLAHVGLFQHRSSAYLHALFVRPEFRKRGAGSLLTLAMDSEARAVGCERVVLQCERDSRLPVYFERLGFRVVGEQQTWTKPE